MGAWAVRRWRVLVAGWLVLVGSAMGASAQTPRDTTVVPGPEYAAGEWKETLLGDDYRDLWTTPLRVEFLNLSTFAGGLTPSERGGGLQTRSLRFQGADGREYTFRSVSKNPDLTLELSLRGTFIADLIQDQTSSLHPSAALAVAPLLSAVGVPHVTPRLYVMPDDPRLGEFREEFAGILGQIEERPQDEEDGGAGFRSPPFSEIIGTPALLERLEESPEDRLDARTYLTARLMDLLIGDWDRHEDQWRWGQLERNGVRYWMPIPRDRDYAFVDYDGVLLDVGRRVVPNAVQFDPRIRNVSGLSLNARALDRRFLAELDRAAWDSIAASIQTRLTDAVIDAAVQRVPPEHRVRSPEIASRLKTRRGDLARAATRFYDLLSTEVDIRATDEPDVAVVDRTGEGIVDVRLFATNDRGEAVGQPYFQRSLKDQETVEVRLYLHGDDDRAIVRGAVGRSIMVRVIGGGGDDLLVDSSVVRTGGTKAAFYDGRGDNELVRGVATAVEEDDFQPPEPTRGLSGETYRDWGESSGFAPSISYGVADGVIIGGGPTATRFGFWKDPYASRLRGRVRVGLGSGAVAVDVSGDFRNTASGGGYSFLFSGSQLDPLRFYGFGNDTEAPEETRFYMTRQTELLGRASVHFGLPSGGRLSVGPIVKHTWSDIDSGTPFQRENVYGKRFGQVGAIAEAELDTRDNRVFPRRGVLVRAGGSGYPDLWDSEGFEEAHATASVYWTPSFGWEPTVALRAGGRKVWGNFPIHEAAYLGGSRTLRGYQGQRFAGDAMVFGNAEVRAPLATVQLLVRGTLGVHGMFDIGRVYLDGESSDRWHTASGGGVWFRFRIRRSTLGASVTHARGDEKSRTFILLGAPF